MRSTLEMPARLAVLEPVDEQGRLAWLGMLLCLFSAVTVLAGVAFAVL